MNANNETPESPYVVETASAEPWIKSKAGKLTALIAGGVIALGGAFGAGVAVGAQNGLGFERNAGGFGDRDGDHFMPNGQFGPRHGDDDNFKMPNPMQSPGVQNN